MYTKSFRILSRFFTLLMLLVLFTGCESRKIIVNGLDEKEANEILVYLGSKNINANKVQAIGEAGGGGSKAVLWNISVEESQSNEAMALLNQVGLPRRRGQNLLNIFQSSSLVPTGMQEKIRYQAGLAEQIASTIRKIDGVLDADVQISFPEEDPLNPNATKQKITASVYVKHNGILDDPNAHLVTRIKRLVAGSVNGLDYDYVTVIPDRSRYGESTQGIFQGSLSGEEDKQYVHVWSLVIAKDSLFKFRLFFFSFILSIVILTVALAWTLWKFYPVIHQAGTKTFFSLHPIHVEGLKNGPIEQVKKESAIIDKEKEKAEQTDSSIEKGIDET